MFRVNLYPLVIVMMAAAILCGSPTPASSQMYPSEISADQNTGNTGTVPPPGPPINFIRQDPLPESLKDIIIYTSNEKEVKFKVIFPDVFDYEIAIGSDGKEYRRYKANSGFKVYGEVGEPEILNRMVWIQVPADAKDFILKSESRLHKGERASDIAIYPIPKIEFGKDPQGLTGSSEVFMINEDLYQKDFWYPQAEAQIAEISIKHDMKLVCLAVPVMVHNPLTSTIQEFKEAMLNLSYTSSMAENKINIMIPKDPFHKVFVSMIPNYAYTVLPPSNATQGAVVEIHGDDLTNPDYAQQSGFFPDYLVIAAKTFHNTQGIMSPALQDWADHRSGQGGAHNIAVAYAEEIQEKYPQPLLEEKIKAFIQMVYTSWRLLENAPSLHFLLLVGDADFGGNNQAWYLPTWRSNPQATDTGDNDYSWLDGDDTLNDVMMGRLPAKDEENLLNMVKKITNFEEYQPVEVNHYGTRVIMLYGDLYRKLITPKSYTNTIRKILLGNKQELDEFHTDYLRELSPFKYDSDTITSLLNTNGALFLGYHAHGGPGSWGPNVNVFDLDNEDKLPLSVLSLACNTAWFDLGGGDCLGEEWLKMEEAGSVCFFGATREASQSDVAFLPIFYDVVYNQKVHLLGTAIDVAKMGVNVYTGRKIHVLLGDPAIDFSAYQAESIKPDLIMEETVHAPKFPTKYGQDMLASFSARNNSNQIVNDVPMKIFSVNSGNLEEFVHPGNPHDPWLLTFGPYARISQSLPWSYEAESSRHLMAWVDPDNKVEELSEFNNWFNSDIAYFPIYVDANTTAGSQYGTEEEPFKELSSAIAHLFSPLADCINETYRVDQQKAVEIVLKNGVYGDGSVLETGSLFLKSKNGAKKTVVYDSLKINGNACRIEDITFDGQKGGNSEPGIHIISKLTYIDEPYLLLRNIFKNYSGYAAAIEHVSSAYMPPTGVQYIFYNLRNNIFEQNFGTIFFERFFVADGLFLTNNTFTNNTNNLFLSIQDETWSLGLITSNNIMWNSGNTNGTGFYPAKVSVGANFNDISDDTFWSVFGISPSPIYGNINQDPRFRNPQSSDFQLKADSPCIDKGMPQVAYFDPDGTRNDMGAYGGPEAIIRQIKIRYPVEDSTIHFDQNPIAFNIEWRTHDLVAPGNFVKIYMYHIDYKPGSPQEIRIVDIDHVLVPNTLSYQVTLNQVLDNESYYLTITDPNNSKAFDIISFKVMKDEYAIESNR